MSANNKAAATYHPHISFEASAAYYAARGRLLGEDPDDGDGDYEDTDRDAPADVTGRYEIARHYSRWTVIDHAHYDAERPIYDTRAAAEARWRQLEPTPTLPFEKEPQMSSFTQPDGLPESQSDMEQIQRNRWGQPLITPPGGGKAVGYQRVTTFIKALDDGAGLEKWKMSRVAIGLMARPDLRMAVESLAPGVIAEDKADKKALAEVCEQAMEAAASSARATIGTALHRITERLDRGEDAPVPEFAQADVDAYRRATAGFQWLHIERMTVHDDLKVAGTPDRVALVDGVPTICDLKTGTSLWPSSHAMQLGVYANSHLYDISTGARSDMGARKDKGLVIHVPAGTGRADLVWVDIAAGWEAAQLAVQVREWRKRRDLATPYTPERPDFAALAAIAGSVDDLLALHAQAVAAGCWDDAVKAAFSARKAELTAVAA